LVNLLILNKRYFSYNEAFFVHSFLFGGNSNFFELEKDFQRFLDTLTLLEKEGLLRKVKVSNPLDNRIYWVWKPTKLFFKQFK
jgi:hypothetical protein